MAAPALHPPTDATAALALRDVVKDYPGPGGRKVRAVDHVSLSLADGEFFSLLGPSGCGKSTTLRMLAGFEQPTAGEITIAGQDMVGVPPYRRPVNMVFQSYALFPHLTVAGNLAFGLEMKGLPRPEIERRVAAALGLVRLDEMGPRRPGQLSGGQQQRVALARALINEPAVLLLDEPLGALDLKLRREMQIELKQLQQRLGITFVYVTHDQEEALAMSDRIGVMDRGRLLQVGPPTEIYERPNCRFVADFIGEANFLEGRVEGREEGHVRVRAAAADLTVLGLPGAGVGPGQAVTVAIRPEKLRLTQARPEQAANAVEGRVLEVVYIGSDTRVTVAVGPELRLVAWDSNEISTLDPDFYYRVGEGVWVSWPPENALVLGD